MAGEGNVMVGDECVLADSRQARLPVGDDVELAARVAVC